MEQSTQWGVSLPNTFPMKKQLKSRNPALNIPRRREAVATDDRIPSTTPGAEPSRDAKDSDSARSHPTHLETSSSNRP